MVERLFLAVPRGCLQFVIVVFPDHTHLLFFLSLCNFQHPILEKTRHINLLPLARINIHHGEVEVLSRMFLVIISKC